MGIPDHWQFPGQLLESSSGYWESCAIHAGVELGLFTCLGSSELDSEAIASACECNTAACEQLLNALCAIGLLAFDGEHYSNTEYSSKFLTKESPLYLGSIINHHRRLALKWVGLTDVIKVGQTPSDSQESDSAELEDFLKGMANMGTINGPGILDLVKLSDRRSLLDVGSGPGMYAAQFCGHYPELNATLFDRPKTKPFVKEIIKRFGLEDRMRFIAGDFNTDPIGDNYDVIWGSHILHSNPPECVQELITKFFKALVPGGELFIQEFILDDDKCGPVFPALFSLNMLVNTASGRSYSQGEIDEMLRHAGFIHLDRLEPPGTASILTAQKP